MIRPEQHERANLGFRSRHGDGCAAIFRCDKVASIIEASLPKASRALRVHRDATQTSHRAYSCKHGWPSIVSVLCSLIFPPVCVIRGCRSLSALATPRSSDEGL
jgi:hypothetical protein